MGSSRFSDGPHLAIQLLCLSSVVFLAKSYLYVFLGNWILFCLFVFLRFYLFMREREREREMEAETQAEGEAGSTQGV